MLVMVLVAAVVWIDRSELTARAEAENGDGITLPHVHSEEGGVCYHHHSGDTAAGGGCYTVPVSCGGSITAKTEETYCGDSTITSIKAVPNLQTFFFIHFLLPHRYKDPHRDPCLNTRFPLHRLHTCCKTLRPTLSDPPACRSLPLHPVHPW